MKHTSRTNWAKVDRLTDAQIDYSDIPEMGEAFFKKAKLYMPRRKDSVTLRIDHNILQWFKDQGRGYQTKINAVLKTFVRSHQQHAA